MGSPGRIVSDDQVTGMNKPLRETQKIMPAALEREPQVDIIETYAAFERLKRAWEAVHSRDPNAGVFLSWDWLAWMFRANPGRWRIYALRDEGLPGGYAAFLPVRHNLHWSRSTERFQTQVTAAGRLGFSEYTGFVCAPEHEELAIPALARFVATQPWARLSLRYEPTQTRLDLFADMFDPDAFDVEWPAYTLNDGETNQLVSPQVALPDSFDAWMDTISARQRKKIRRAMRSGLEDRGLTIRSATADNFADQADRLIDFWAAKWDGEKSADQVIGTARKYRKLLDQAQELGVLYMPSLWEGERMLGAIAHVVDPKSRSLVAMVEGRDAAATDVEVGLLLHSHAIRQAIRAGLGTYDFGHGDERYKYSYGAQDLPLGYMVITRRTPETAPVLDRAQMQPALERTLAFLEDGKVDRATTALRQLTAFADPRLA
jgi:hypothetical protein